MATAVASTQLADVDSQCQNLSPETKGLWTNGAFKAIKLSPAASDKQVILRSIKDRNDSNRESELKMIHILKSLKVHISNQEYRAVIVDTNQGQKIFLIQHQKGLGWWIKSFAVEDATSDKPLD